MWLKEVSEQGDDWDHIWPVFFKSETLSLPKKLQLNSSNPEVSTVKTHIKHPLCSKKKNQEGHATLGKLTHESNMLPNTDRNHLTLKQYFWSCVIGASDAPELQRTVRAGGFTPCSPVWLWFDTRSAEPRRQGWVCLHTDSEATSPNGPYRNLL